ncbi:MAG: class IIb bacteriocin, lactobin A/cerein 7B family [Mogibacterium sp.]|nr:class IIb bacteriocin, lactobin A/cerein 7B family [Mogibacterium sp.]
MELAYNNGFVGLSKDEMYETSGGSMTVLGVCAVVVAVGGACGVCYRAGKAIGQAAAHYSNSKKKKKK